MKEKSEKSPLNIPSKPFYQIVLPNGKRLDDIYTWRSPGNPHLKGATGGKRWKQINYLKSRIKDWLHRGGVSYLTEARVVKYVPIYQVEETISVAEFVGKELFAQALTKDQIRQREEEAKRKKRLEKKLKQERLDKQKRKALYEELKREFGSDQE